MKRIGMLIVILILLCGTCFAEGEYPDYLNGDINYPLVYGHMGMGFYLDKSSITIKENNKKTGSVIFAENIVQFNIDKNEFGKTYTIWFNEPVDRKEFNVAYVSNDGENWRKFYVNDTHGYNMSTRNSFLLGWKSIFYYDWPS